jgi:CHAT domain-containing protein/Tfp pilus assembly protein PilF
MSQISGPWEAIRRGAALVIIVALAGCAHPSSTHTQTMARPRAMLDEAARLDKTVNTLYDKGRFQEAIPLTERSLSLRERALGPRHPDVAISLNNLARLYQAQGAYARAEPLYARALGIRQKALGAMHPDVAASLNNLGELYFAQAAYAHAEPLFVRALDIREKMLGAMHPDVAESLNDLAVLYWDQGTYTRAEPLFVRALDIREKVLGATHPDVAQSLNNLALLYQDQGAYARAEPLYVRALDIREKVLGATHPDVAISLSNLATIYKDQGMYTQAEPLLVRALNIQENTLGAMHPDVATSLSNLAIIYKDQGTYARAESLLVRALDIREKVLGATHPDVAANLNNLARLYQDQGAYARAEPLFLRALDIWKKIRGPMHPNVATSLNNLARLYQDQGAYARAEPLFIRALDIWEKTRGPMHPDVATGLDNLAVLYKAQDAYARAEPLNIRALEIREKVLGAMHPDVATSLNNLASLYQDQGTYARAEPLFVRALDIWEKTLGEMHPNFASSLHNLARLYQAQGAYARAEPLYLRALDIHEKALGAMHPDVAASLNNLALLYQTQGAYGRAVPLLARVAELREANLRTELTRLSESRKRDLLSLLQGETQRLIWLHAHAMPTNPQALELAFTTTLRRKGLVLDSLTDNQATLRDHLTPQLRGSLAQLADARTQLSTRLRAPFNPQTAAKQKSAIASLHVRIDDLEAELNKASVEFRVQTEPVTIGKIQAALPRGAALVELVRYRHYDAQQAQAQNRWQEGHYLAYLLFAHGSPQWVELGDATRIDAGVDAMLAAMRKGASADAAKVALRQLDAFVFAPIRERLGGVTHIIVSPDGKLNLVPFDALVDPQGHYALEQRLISYVTSGRDLLRISARRASRSPATIVADPDYGPPGKPYVRVDGTLAETYGRLAGTLVEAKEIERYFLDSKTLTSGQATKAALTSVVGPSVLHVATHGFYMHVAASRISPPVPQRPDPKERDIFVDEAAPPPSSSSEDPTDALDHAGLALAGANVSPDGIISARELASRDWWGTQLVVLSACGTGVGAVLSGDGVYGLRRALVLAGAQSQVTSLWNVNDALAPELMREFYAELARGTGRAEALRRAKLRILQQPRFAHPYYWAAFIPAGDWTPLAPRTMRSIGSAPTVPVALSSTKYLIDGVVR